VAGTSWSDSFDDLPEPVDLEGRAGSFPGPRTADVDYFDLPGSSWLGPHGRAATAAATVIAYLHRLGCAEEIAVVLQDHGSAPDHQGGFFQVPLRLTIGPAATFRSLLCSVEQRLDDFAFPSAEHHRGSAGHSSASEVIDRVSALVVAGPAHLGETRRTPVFWVDCVTGAAGSAAVAILAPAEHAAPACPPAVDAYVWHRNRLKIFLWTMVERPDEPIRNVEILTGEEWAVLGQWAGKVTEKPEVCLHEVFEAQVRHYPQRRAVAFEDTTLTYRELNDRANRLARRLVARGVRVDDIVAVAVPRSPDLVVAMLATLKAGAAYLPIDLDAPRARISQILTDAHPCAVIKTSALALDDVLPHTYAVDMDNDWFSGSLARHPPHDLTASDRGRELHTDDAAYVIYTSGSTGAPKGVVVTHESVVNHMLWMAEEYPLDDGDVVLARTSVAFDAAGWEIWLPLTSGATLCLTPAYMSKNLDELLRYMSERQVTVAQFVPSLLANLPPQRPRLRVRTVFCGGEVLPPELARRTARQWQVDVVNLYGPTEATIQVTSWRCAQSDRSGSTPIGRPIHNTAIHVLDEFGNLAPPGVAGELGISGRCLARGYLNRPELTAERFTCLPAGLAGLAGTRVYRTGDLGRWLEDGVLEYIRRLDDQVKVRGYRIEPGEVECAVRRLAGDVDCTVIARVDHHGENRLIAYLVAPEGHQVDVDVVKAGLFDALPAYMVPSAFVKLDRWPLTPNQKLDRAALPDPAPSGSPHYDPPRNRREEAICAALADLLQVERVGLLDNFFALGGDSLLAMRFANMIRSSLGLDVSVVDILERPLVEDVVGSILTSPNDRPPVRRLLRPDDLPASPLQERLWFLHMAGDGSAYNMPIAVEMTGTVDERLFTSAVLDVVERHEALRTRFRQTTGSLQQVVADPAEVDLAAVYSRVAGPVDPGALEEMMDAEASREFDLTSDLPLRIVLADAGEDEEHLLLVVLHHIAGDDFSLGLLLRDLFTAYTARCRGEAPRWPPLPLQYADYALWQRRLLGEASQPTAELTRQLGYWATTLDGLPDFTGIPTAARRPEVRSGDGAVEEFELDATLHRALAAMAGHHSASLFMVLHCAVAAFVEITTGVPRSVIASPLSGRVDTQLENLVGFFLNTLILRVEHGENPTLRELLASVRAADLGAYANGDAPLHLVVDAVNPARSPGWNPIAQVELVLENVPDFELSAPGLREVTVVQMHTGTAKFDISFHFRETRRGPDDCPRGMRGFIEYDPHLFTPETTAVYVARLRRVFEYIAWAPDTGLAHLRKALTADDDGWPQVNIKGAPQ
jgi:nonribosomal peptide synthetase DhbF